MDRDRKPLTSLTSPTRQNRMRQHGPSRRSMTEALKLWQTITAMTPAEKAQRRFEAAKQELDEATRALMNCEPGAIERADAALHGMLAARDALAAVNARRAND